LFCSKCLAIQIVAADKAHYCKCLACFKPHMQPLLTFRVSSFRFGIRLLGFALVGDTSLESQVGCRRRCR